MIQKLSFTQKKITKTFFRILLLVACIIIFRLIISVIPPFINKINVSDIESENLIKITGLHFRNKNLTSNIYIDGKAIQENTIVLWTPFTIHIQYSPDLLTKNTLYIQTHNKTSNSKFFIIPSTRTTPISEASTYPYEIYQDFIPRDSAPAISSLASIKPYDLISMSPMKYQATLLSISSNSYQSIIPTYLTTFNDKTHSLFFDDSLFFNNISQTLTLEVSYENNMYTYPIILTPLYPNTTLSQQQYSLVLSYPSTQSQYVYMHPIQSAYQQTMSQDNTLISNILLQNYFANNTIHTTINIHAKSGVINLNDSKNIMPVLYSPHILLEYLFASSPLTTAELAIITDALVEYSNLDTINIPTKYTTPTIHSQFELASAASNERNTASNLEIQALNNALHEYIMGIIAFTSTVTLEQLQQMSFYPSLISLEIDTTHIAQNILLAKILRSQDIVARTVIGIHTAQYTNTTDTSIPHTSWVEILTKKSGWLNPYTGTSLSFQISKKNHIALYIFEEYLMLLAHKQRPLSPRISSLSIIQED